MHPALQKSDLPPRQPQKNCLPTVANDGIWGSWSHPAATSRSNSDDVEGPVLQHAREGALACTDRELRLLIIPHKVHSSDQASLVVPGGPVVLEEAEAGVCSRVDPHLQRIGRPILDVLAQRPQRHDRPRPHKHGRLVELEGHLGLARGLPRPRVEVDPRCGDREVGASSGRPGVWVRGRKERGHQERVAPHELVRDAPRAPVLREIHNQCPLHGVARELDACEARVRVGEKAVAEANGGDVDDLHRALPKVPELRGGPGPMHAEDRRERAELEPAYEQVVVCQGLVLILGPEKAANVLRPIGNACHLVVQRCRNLAPQ
mmetsp:Transcript_86514/g.239893  ORF Transcript_86514/g.239893 Transcript_86514/m.239893 type:complete len:319 (+) Transcript_86514:218-1174(+)